MGPAEEWFHEVTLPVVFNVLQMPGGRTFTEADITAQLAQLNEDFAGLAPIPDGDLRPQSFANVELRQDTRIRFCYAGPGSAAAAINFRQVDFNERPTLAQITDSIVGIPATSSGEVINVWVVDLGRAHSGYALFPNTPAEWDGLVIGERYFGISDDPEDPYGRGHSLTHLVAEHIGLAPIYGNNHCGDDGIRDTPVPDGPSIGRPGVGAVSVCSGDLRMTMNFMDDSYDDQLYSFTKGQIRYLHASLHASPYEGFPSGPRVGLRDGDLLCDGPPTVNVMSPTTSTPADVTDAAGRLQLFPNPATGSFTLRLSDTEATIDHVTLYDLHGRRLTTLQTNQGAARTRVPTEGYGAGVYIVEVHLSSGGRMVRRVTVQ